MQYQIEDRTKNRPGTSFAGKWILWQTLTRPFPHHLFCGAFDTKQEAEAKERILLILNKE